MAELTKISREIILNNIQVLTEQIETQGNLIIKTTNKEFVQSRVFDLDILRGNLARYRMAIINNSFEEIN